MENSTDAKCSLFWPAVRAKKNEKKRASRAKKTIFGKKASFECLKKRFLDKNTLPPPPKNCWNRRCYKLFSTYFEEKKFP